VTSRRTAPTALCRYTPTSFAKSFPLPIGTTPSATSAPPGERSNPFATSCTVPSPPTATTRCAPACTARAASSVAVARPRGPLHLHRPPLVLEFARDGIERAGRRSAAGRGVEHHVGVDQSLP